MMVLISFFDVVCEVCVCVTVRDEYDEIWEKKRYLCIFVYTYIKRLGSCGHPPLSALT